MKKKTLQSAVALVLTQSMWAAAAPALAQEPEEPFDFRYTAYFVCGTPEPGAGGQLALGEYATQINMANWHGTSLEMRKKVAFTYPPRLQTPGVHSDWIGPEVIERNHALSVDCEEIVGSKRHPSEFVYSEGSPVLEDGSEPTFYTGYLMIQSRRALNVTTVQTVGPRPGKGGSDDDESEDDNKGNKKRSQVHSIAVTNVPERRRAEFQQHGDEEP